MRSLNRLDKPQRLVLNEVRWTSVFISSGKPRPSSKQYGHLEIKEQLAKISFYKCFYSEVKFSQLSEAQIDHYVEVAEDPNSAFKWENLYLSHISCNNGKTSNIVLPNASCLDPFTHSDGEIENHLDFEDEMIQGLTQRGLNTIQKYNLDKPIFNTLRANELRKIHNLILAAYKNKLPEDDLKVILKRFASIDKPFSLMIKKKLIKSDLW
ncbi:HNH endonuclease family protein [Myroides sp. LJL115]